MKHIEVSSHPIDEKELNKVSAKFSDTKTLIDSPCVLTKDGKPIIIYSELDNLKDIEWAVKTIKYMTDTRTDGLKTTSRIFGFKPRNPLRTNFCSITSMATEFPAQHKIICDTGVRIAEIYKQFGPEKYQDQLDHVKTNVKSDWIIPNTPFTSGVVNKNNPLNYHFDSGNFEGYWSCMVVLRDGVQGGMLSVPEFNLKIDLKNGALLFFDGQSLLHGVTPIQKLRDDGYRYSVVYYSLKQMCKCGTPKEELDYVRRSKTKIQMERV